MVQPALVRVGALCLAAWLPACSTANFDLAGPAPGYAAAHPYYAEFCALSQLKRKARKGTESLGGIGGHAVFYLHGACRVEGAGFPVLRLCSEGTNDGVGISMNEHFRNAKWVATPGRAFFYDGAGQDGAGGAGGLTAAGYARTQAEAKRLGIYGGVQFHDAVFADMPAGWTAADWMYEVSASTDYAVGMGRGRYCARVPATSAQMAAMVEFLNRENTPYRTGATFRWSLLRDNCIHLAHNALAAAGFWAPLPTHRSWLAALLTFPVPRNEFVNIMRRGNAPLPADPLALMRDGAAWQAVVRFGTLPMGPGTLAAAHPPHSPNALYDTDVDLIFFDDPVVGSYQPSFDRIFADARHFDADANRAAYARLAAGVLARRQPLAWWQARGGTAATPAFAEAYVKYYALLAATVGD